MSTTPNKEYTYMAKYILKFYLFRFMDPLVLMSHFSKKRKYVNPAIVSRSYLL